MEAVRVYTRYDLPDDKNQTRRERNESINIYTPPFEIPDDGFYLWSWFTELNNSISRIDFNGYYSIIPPSEYLAWCKLTGNCLYPEEFDILQSMDVMFCKEMNLDINAKRARDEEERNRKMNRVRNRR